MAEEFEFRFTVPQIEALVRALENNGVNSGSYRPMIESFRTTELANAAKSAHGILRRKGQKQSKPSQETIARELTKDSAIGDVRESLRRQREDYTEVLQESTELLTAVLALRSALSRRLNVQRDPAEQAAIGALETVLGNISYSEFELAGKLRDLLWQAEDAAEQNRES